MSDLPSDATTNDRLREAVGFGLDALLGTSALGAWLLEIEKAAGAVGAALIFILAVATAIYRFLYWRSKAKREQEALDWDRMK